MFDIKKANQSKFIQDVLPDGSGSTPPFLLFDNDMYFYGFVFYTFKENKIRNHGYQIAYFNQEYEYIGYKDIDYIFENSTELDIRNEYESLLIELFNKNVNSDDSRFDQNRFNNLNQLIFEDFASEVNKKL